MNSNSKYKLKIVDSKNIFGTMNSGTIRLTNITPDDREMIMLKNNLEFLDDYELTRSDKSTIFLNHRQKFGEANGFDGQKMFMADQVYKDGSHFELTEDYVKANPNGWTDIPEDILVITDKVPGVVIGHPVADCPVVIMEAKDKGITALAHCSAELIDKKMPMMIADCLTHDYGLSEDEIKVYVGACAGKDWAYDSLPKWAQDKKVWEGCIIEENVVFRIDLKKALEKQFKYRKLNNVIYSNIDTIKDNNYYSNSEARINPNKFGRQFIGAF